MPADQSVPRRFRDSLFLASVSCWALGAGLLAWGLAPVVLARLFTRSTVHWDTLASSAITLLVGGVYVGLGQLIRRRINWALRLGLCLSVLLLAVILGMLLLNGARAIPLFPTALALCTTMTCWLALTTQDAVGSQL